MWRGLIALIVLVLAACHPDADSGQDTLLERQLPRG